MSTCTGSPATAPEATCRGPHRRAQTGKTTLARAAYRELRYVNLDEIEARAALRDTRTRKWAQSVEDAIFDEAQKEPTVFDKVKYGFDAGEIDFTVLLGSSRFLLLDRVRETLAGRAFVYELWPLMLSELLAPSGSALPRPLLQGLIEAPRVADVLEAQPETLLGDESERRQAAFETPRRVGRDAGSSSGSGRRARCRSWPRSSAG